MAKIVGIKFRDTGKIYYFDPADTEFSEGDGVVCETARGTEYGIVAVPPKEASGKDVVAPLKPILRKADDEDEKRHLDNLKKREEIMKIAAEKAQKNDLEMKIVDAEYTFDRQKVIIYFTAEGRIDFRELVRELAGVFRVRIELRQIYGRDDIKLRGALAACGRPCCCTTFLRDFEKVSIKMAKIQNLSLNPQKISGCCGKLMCCLKFENQYYQDTFKKMPKINTPANTPDGKGIVISNNPLLQEVTVKIFGEEGEILKTYPLEKINSQFIQNPDEFGQEDESDELKEE